MAFICELVFVCLCLLCFGLVIVLNLIPYWVPVISVTHTLSFESKRCSYATFRSRWVVFVVVFWDEFSTIFQSFIVFVMREGVTVRNLKTDSNSEFGCPNTAEERERCARRLLGQKPSKGWPRVPHGQSSSLATCGTRWPHVGWQNVPQKFGQFCPSFNSF